MHRPPNFGWVTDAALEQPQTRVNAVSKMTKQHFEDAAERIREGSYTKGERALIGKFLTSFFRHWNGEFSSQRFLDTCEPQRLTPKRGLKKSIAKNKKPQVSVCLCSHPQQEHFDLWDIGDCRGACKNDDCFCNTYRYSVPV